MGAQGTIQDRITAQQDLDAITYALRAGKARSQGFYEAATAQWQAGLEVAARTTGSTGDEWSLKRAQKAARERLNAAKAAEKELGGIRQVRIELKEAA